MHTEHFGLADCFKIYEYRSTVPKLIKVVNVVPYSQSDPSHRFDIRGFRYILNAINGCNAIVVAQIGVIPERELKNCGIDTVKSSAPLIQALKIAHDQVRPEVCRHSEGKRLCSLN
jgi:predicted Fe-Mo cluster-binding NifX family protein